MKHSELPWYVTGEIDEKYAEANLHIGNGVSPMVLLSINPIHTEAEANAQFIVKACNSHYKLLSQLEKASMYLAAELGGDSPIVQGLKQAIKEAE